MPRDSRRMPALHSGQIFQWALHVAEHGIGSVIAFACWSPGSSPWVASHLGCQVLHYLEFC
jgi:hypothetical protein